MTENNLNNENWLRQVTTPLGQARVPCSQCSMQGVCEALAGDEDDKTFVRRGRLGSGQTLFHAGDVFHGVYAVTSGAIKTYALLDKEDTQVVDFHFPGDTVGLEAIDSGTYTYTARALTETLVCRVDVDNPHLPGERQAGVQHAMIHALSEQLRHEQSLSILLRKQNAEQRIVTFLLSLAGPSAWTPARGIDLQLPMSRKDIANYLGIAVETLCRLFKRLQDDGLVDSQGRHVRLLDVATLTELAHPVERAAVQACTV